MELSEFIDREMTEFGPRNKRWPMRFQISFYRMVAHLYEPIPSRFENLVDQKTIFKPFVFNHPIPLEFPDRDNWLEKFPELLQESKLKELGHPNFQQNFCDFKGTVRHQVSIWNCAIKFDELVCVKLMRIKNRSLLCESSFEFHLLMKKSN